jgi:nucleoside-diphosphate-sugar epimerase
MTPARRPKPLEAPSIVVIGGSGFVGSGLVERIAESARVAMLSRSGRWKWGARPIGMTGIACDITEGEETARLYELFRGARIVVNLAGSLWKPSLSKETYERVHVHGTRLLLDALHAAVGTEGPIRLVHVSTTGVLGPTGPNPKSESDAPAPSNEYERTKLEGERLALAGRGPGLEVVVVRPGLVYGPRDLHLLPFFRAIDRRQFRPIAKGKARWQPIYVDDVVRGILAAMHGEGLDGAVLHLAGAERVTVGQFAARIAGALGRKPQAGSIPYTAAFAAGAVLEAITAPLRGDPPLTRARVRTLTQDRLYRIAEAERRLGWKPEVLLDRGLVETVGWYRAQNFLGR